MIVESVLSITTLWGHYTHFTDHKGKLSDLNGQSSLHTTCPLIKTDKSLKNIWNDYFQTLNNSDQEHPLIAGPRKKKKHPAFLPGGIFQTTVENPSREQQLCWIKETEIGVGVGWGGWNLRDRIPEIKEVHRERTPDICLRVLLETVDHKGQGDVKWTPGFIQ